MNPEHDLIRYAWPDSGSFWQWSRDADAVNWHDGSTLALYQEIESVLRRLQPNGWPPFEQLLLLIAASRRSWNGDGARSLSGYLEVMELLGWDASTFQPLRIKMFDALAKAHALAANAGFEPGTAGIISEMAFAQNREGADAETAGALLSLFRNGTAAVYLRQKSMVAQPGAVPVQLSHSVWQTFSGVVGSCERLDPNANLSLFRETGLPDLPFPANIDDLPVVERIRALVKALVESDEHELAGMARIARNLSAVVSLPRPVSDQDDMPLGGYSDVANRGSLDRLLVTELAQDPDILAVRVALNEALYLRRESPPRQPSRRRAIFIDTGIRMWGLPRVFAHSLALAFAMQSDRDAVIEIFTEQGPAMLDSIDGLTRLLSQLSPASRPEVEFEEFLKTFANEEADCILITTPAVCRDRDFQQLLSKNHETEFFIAAVDRDGRYELTARNVSGQRLLQNAQLDLDQLLGMSADSDQQLLRDRAAWLPTILRQKAFPLRLAANIPIKKTIYHEEVGLVGHSKDGMILQWQDADRGAKLISDSIPRGIVTWSEIEAESQTAWFFLPRADGTAILLTADLESGGVHEIRLDHGLEIVRHVCRIGQILVLLGDSRATGHQLRTGERLHVRDLGRITNRSERFIKIDHIWQAITVGVSGLELEELPGKLAIARVWENPDFPAPLVLTQDLMIACLTDPIEELSPRLDARFAGFEGISSDRNRLFVWSSTREGLPKCRHFVDVKNRSVFNCPSSSPQQLEPYATQVLAKTPSIRKRFKIAAISEDGELKLVRGRNKVITLTSIQSSLPRLEWMTGGSLLPDRNLSTFEVVESLAGSRFGLKKAQWPDGSSAWLDQRGLLHLKSSDKSIPEVSIILKNGPTSAWASTGEMTGSDYFIDEAQAVEPEIIFGYVRKFADQIRLHREQPEPAGVHA
jgi:hypothetical protein